ncbi:TetR/AcrR family transcriptional regulator [Amycolatopsis saalfeldensis]|uniref:DNA-binding transcriptional regulator, AcrR family n=1 Tax=Amycolatopsis saalfeldensis TaxID=394193 RepID=A0A1H8UWN6_9PSEU|nr:TetR/AcrR family transcriptional regulator [Amycolatopsis saalfeldensis]SEP07571.1 DNA-binding transcriptional regulator, AcrR family [Amycolatopsis saalfeldensis]
MARRGDALREHILWAAKDVFIETGFERASMDVVAARAETSKRSLYAHFESKDKLFLAVLDLVRELYFEQLKTPRDYADDATEAAVLFCGRFLQLLLWRSALRTCRLSMTEAERLPEAAARYYDAIFATPQERLAAFVGESFDLGPGAAEDLARELLGRTVYPRLFRALLGVEPPLDERPEEASIATDVDVAAIRRALADLLAGTALGSCALEKQ